MKRLLFALSCLLSFTLQASTTDSLRSVERQWLYGVGHANILDTYLSPYNYTGLQLNSRLRTERKAHFGKGNISVLGIYGGNLSSVSYPINGGKEWDGNIYGSGGCLYNFYPSSRLHIGVGSMMGGGLGFTYNLQNGNNPAQGRLHLSLDAHSVIDYQFRWLHRTFIWRTECQLPLMGLAFTPQYGQSYYEIFGLGHYHRNCVLSYIGNAPSLKLITHLSIPLRKATLQIGYQADVQQSYFHQLKRHAWLNSFVIGFTRRLSILP